MKHQRVANPSEDEDLTNLSLAKRYNAISEIYHGYFHRFYECCFFLKKKKIYKNHRFETLFFYFYFRPKRLIFGFTLSADFTPALFPPCTIFVIPPFPYSTYFHSKIKILEFPRFSPNFE